MVTYLTADYLTAEEFDLVIDALTAEEFDLVIDALNARASRCESEARFYLRRKSTEKARALRKLAEKLEARFWQRSGA